MALPINGEVIDVAVLHKKRGFLKEAARTAFPFWHLAHEFVKLIISEAVISRVGGAVENAEVCIFADETLTLELII